MYTARKELNARELREKRARAAEIVRRSNAARKELAANERAYYRELEKQKEQQLYEVSQRVQMLLDIFTNTQPREY